jgi:hypothetical protein
MAFKKSVGALSILFLAGPGEGFLYSFSDTALSGPAINLRPRSSMIGTPLDAGDAMTVDLTISLTYPRSRAETSSLFPLQLGLWTDEELKGLTNPSAIDDDGWSPELTENTIAAHCGCATDDDDDDYYTNLEKSVEGGAATTDDVDPMVARCPAPHLLDQGSEPRDTHRLRTVWLTAPPPPLTVEEDQGDKVEEAGVHGGVGNSNRGGKEEAATGTAAASSAASSSSNVRWNMTVANRGTYHFGLSSCLPGVVVVASGEVRLERGSASGGSGGGSSGGGGGGGSLPSSILGIVPFYGSLAGLYLIGAAVWGLRVKQFWQHTITLQLTVFVALVLNLGYALLAFAYYLHLDVATSVTAEQVR